MTTPSGMRNGAPCVSLCRRLPDTDGVEFEHCLVTAADALVECAIGVTMFERDVIVGLTRRPGGGAWGDV